MQQNEIEIQPINTWVNGEVKTLSVLRLDNYFQYDFLQCPGRVHYCLCEAYLQTITDDDGDEIQVEQYRSIIDGNVDLPWSLVETWGTDDTPIFDFVLNQLQLTRKP
jgi:hypothetical protein